MGHFHIITDGSQGHWALKGEECMSAPSSPGTTLVQLKGLVKKP